MFDLLKKGKNVDLRSVAPNQAAAEGRLPPGQYLTDKFPVLHYGGVPTFNEAAWDFRVYGLVEEEKSWTWQEFLTLPTTAVTLDIHCVTHWSKFDTTWEGVPLADFLRRQVALKPEAQFMVAHGEHGFTANVPLDLAMHPQALLAYKYGGQPLAPEHGYPMRLLIPTRYFWKSAKWLRGLEFLARDRLGFWEQNGYNNHADPWLEERYSY
ncbi:MAG: sulfite oxidase-like oxidoreductase [Chloroflexota bacterium]